VVEPGGAALEEGSDHHHFFFSRYGGKPLRGGPRYGLGEVEELGIFSLAEILGAEELGKANDVCPATRGFAHAVSGLIEIGVGVG
jgi:hypothetical protein